MAKGELLTDTEKEILEPLLENRIPFENSFFEDEDTYEQGMVQLLEDSKNILLGKLYPFEDYSDYLIPAYKYNWCIRCAIELYNLGDKVGVTSYAENGLSWTRYSDGLSRSLMSELISHVGVPRRKIVATITDETSDDNV